MKSAKNLLGVAGEELAAKFITDCGCQVLARNWRTNRGELDIIALDDSTLVFCEVKTRSTSNYGLPSEAISKTKLQHLRIVALEWLGAHHVRHQGIRFDVISVLMPPGCEPEISHIKGIDL